MNVLIDFSQISKQKAGVGVYGLNLIQNLLKTKSLSYFILVQDDDSSLDAYASDWVILVKVDALKFRRLFYRLFLEQLYIPYLVFKHKIDIVHSLHYSFPIFTKAKKVVTVCDMIFFKYPELHLKSKVLYFRLFIWLTTIFADKVICISKSTEIDYIEKFNTNPSLTTVIELGKDKIFQPNINVIEIKNVLNKYSIRDDYILFIGTIEPRKNLANIILAFSRLVDQFDALKLVIVGKKGWHYDSVFLLVTKLNLENKVIFTGFIDEIDKPVLLVGAKLFVYPSFYEGFGIPVLEALACGTPTITSNISSMPEVAGDAAILVNPNNIDEIYSSMIRLLTDQKLSDELRIKGPMQASKFNWIETAEQTVTTYKSILTSN